LIQVHDVDGQTQLHLSHAVLLENIGLDFYELRNSYRNDPKILIPKNRKTFYQDYIRAKSNQFGNHVTRIDIENLFSKYSTENIEWNVNKWVISDEGYSLQFQLNTHSTN